VYDGDLYKGIKAVRWVETETFIGLDRRLKRMWRLIDRRVGDQSTRAPSLVTALRQLRVQATEVRALSGRAAFEKRARATAELAGAQQLPQAEATLLDLVSKLKNNEIPGDPRYWLEDQIGELIRYVADRRASV
jgi:hypothetical protein